ncbi:MAG TPA: DNA-processing protein DprA [Solirubrobacteraceae bacterium]|nr:DNA-processing protein DprA [Solirubrobacteraceae bacterium]
MTAGLDRGTGGAGGVGPACAECLRRSWLVARLGAQLEIARRRGRELPLIFDLPDPRLIAAIAGGMRSAVEREYERFDPGAAAARCVAAGVETMCRCDPGYPRRLAGTPGAPAVLHVAGGRERCRALLAADAVSIVGARRGTAYGLEVARSLGRSLGAAGLTVVSGMALGIDSAAHTGALEAAGATVAVLPVGAERPYPASKRALYRRIVDSGVAISELPPGTESRRWGFPARNRIIAGLSAMTVVVEAGQRSGSLITAAVVEDLGRVLGAVPGRVTSALSAGTNDLLARGARIVRDGGDVLDAMFGAGTRTLPAHALGEPVRPELRELLEAVGAGCDTLGALAGTGRSLETTLTGLAELELGGRIRREAGGRYVVVMSGA